MLLGSNQQLVEDYLQWDIEDPDKIKALDPHDQDNKESAGAQTRSMEDEEDEDAETQFVMKKVLDAVPANGFERLLFTEASEEDVDRRYSTTEQLFPTANCLYGYDMFPDFEVV